MTSEETIFQEAVSAIENREIIQARDLIIGLLKSNPENPEYWLLMSAVVDTVKERTYCLEETLRLDPENPSAQRGLRMLGILPLDEEQIIPLRLQKRKWDVKLPPRSKSESQPSKPSRQRVLIFSAAFTFIITIVLIGTLGPESLRFHFTAGRQTSPTSRPAHIKSLSPFIGTPTALPTFYGPTPLWMLLEATYTPTPLCVNTPHPRVEAYRISLRAYQREEWNQMIDFLQQASTLEPNAIDLNYHIAEAYRFQLELDQAIQIYNQILHTNPAFAPAYLGSARARLAATPSRLEEAQSDLKKAIEIDPNLYEAYLELASLALDLNDAKLALEWLDIAARLTPDSTLLYYYYSQAFLMLDQLEMALEDALHANELDITFLPGYRLVGQIFIAMEEPSNAVEALQIYTDFIPDDAQALTWLGIAYYARQEFDLALKMLDEALLLDDRLYDAYQTRGSIYLEYNEPILAKEDFLNALMLDTRSFEANLGLGKVYLQLDNNTQAYYQFSVTEAYAISDAEQAQLYYWRAQSLEKLGEQKAALRDWQALLDLPVENIPAELRKYALLRLQSSYTKTPTLIVAPTSSITPTVSQTKTP